jgi:hypothetical protein
MLTAWSVSASVALPHGINATVVDRWRHLAGAVLLPVASLVSGALPELSFAAPVDIHIELRLFATSMTITWPAAYCVVGCANCCGDLGGGRVVYLCSAEHALGRSGGGLRGPRLWLGAPAPCVPVTHQGLIG